MLPTKGILAQEGVNLLQDVEEAPSPVIPLLEDIVSNTAATAEALQNATHDPAPPVLDLIPLVQAIEAMQPPTSPQPLEWHFEIKRNKLNLITDVVARATVRAE